jgi:dTDP-4-dehydrorhamnose 3,5-epimerase
MKVQTTSLPELLIVAPDIYGDSRGFFTETYQQKRYAESGIDRTFVQDNLSRSTKGTLRGLHFQINTPQAKLVQVIEGEVFDVAVDVRPGSPSFGKWEGVRLSDNNMRQLFIPEGFAHGFCVLSDTALFSYKCTDFYAPDDEGGILWSDPDIGIQWPIDAPMLSAKDQAYPLLKDVSLKALPKVVP